MKRRERINEWTTRHWLLAAIAGSLLVLGVLTGAGAGLYLGYQEASKTAPPRVEPQDLAKGEGLPDPGVGASSNTTYPRFTSSRTLVRWQESQHWSPRGVYEPEAIVVHVGVVEPDNCEGLANYLASNERLVSAHFTVCEEEVIQQVEIGDAAHHAGVWGPPNLDIALVREWWNDPSPIGHNPNSRTVGIELALAPGYHINSQPGMRENLIELLTWLSLELDIAPDRQHIIAHSDTDGATRAQDPHCCVNLEQIIEEVRIRVEARAPRPLTIEALDPDSACWGPTSPSWNGRWNVCREAWIAPNGNYFKPSESQWFYANGVPINN